MMQSRLFRRLLLCIVLLFGLVANASSLYSGWLLNTHLSEQYRSKALGIARSVAFSDLDTIIDSDAATVQARIDQYLDLEGVSYVVVTGQNGNIIAHTFVPSIPLEVQDVLSEIGRRRALDESAEFRELVFSDGSKTTHIAVPVLAGVGGFVHIGMDRDLITNYITSAALKQQMLTLTFFALSIIAAYLFMRSISAPLSDLTSYAHKVAAHDFSATIDINRQDEIGELATAMRSMSADLARLIINLEQSVADKTVELQNAVSYVKAIISNIADGLLVVDEHDCVAQYNSALVTMFGLDDTDLEGRSVCEVFGYLSAMTTITGERNSFVSALCSDNAESESNSPAGRSVFEEDSTTQQAAVRKRDGSPMVVEFSLVRLLVLGSPMTICLVRDVTQRKRAEEQLRNAHDLLEQKVVERTKELSRTNSQLMLENAERRVVEQALRRTEERYRSIFENAIEGIFQTTPRGQLLNINPALARILGYASPDEMIATITDVGRQVYVEPDKRDEFVRQLEERGEISDFEFEARTKNGDVLWMSSNARRVLDNSGATAYYEGFMEDVTLRKVAQEKLRHQAFHDPLTDLPNRLLFLDHLRMAIARGQRRKGYLFAVLYLDLDRFKIINDSLGHDTGDELLRYVADKLRECVRETDTVARFGGDEFAILLEELEMTRDAVRIARRIQHVLKKPIEIHGHEVFTSASIGIVLKTDGYTVPDDVLRDADTAMYRAKEMGKARFKVFNQRMYEQAIRLLSMETELRKAVERKEFTVHYQPIVNLENDSLVGFEALIRWRHSELGAISPEEFVPVAEDTGLINEMGAFVLNEAAARIVEWNRYRDDALPPLYVSVNISGRQFMQPHFSATVENVLKEGTGADMLRLEITESVLMEQGTLAIDTVSKLRAMGIRMCIDDFGTGYSSLVYLQRLPVDTIKVDRAFVGRLDAENEGRSIVRSIISLGDNLSMEVIAEGVETLAQARHLRDLGCRYAQGYLYARPMPVEEVQSLLEGRSGQCFSCGTSEIFASGSADKRMNSPESGLMKPAAQRADISETISSREGRTTYHSVTSGDEQEADAVTGDDFLDASGL